MDEIFVGKSADAAAGFKDGMVGDGRMALMFGHASALRTYSRRTVLDGVGLSVADETDRRRMMQEFLALGRSLNLSGRRMVEILCGS
jgi:hypothetical protein